MSEVQYWSKSTQLLPPSDASLSLRVDLSMLERSLTVSDLISLGSERF